MNSSGTRRDQYLRSCRERVGQHMQKRFDTFLAELPNKLFELAEKAGNNRDQSLLFDARKQVEQQHEAISKQFLRHIENAFDAFSAHKATVSAQFSEIDSSDLRLVENDSLEISIALSTMAHKAETRAAEELYALNQRLSAIRGGAKIANGQAPVEPAVLVEAMAAPFEPLPIDTKTRLTIFKLFDQSFMVDLEAFYHELNSFFIEGGILSNLRFEINRSSADGAAESASARRDVFAESGMSAGSVDAQQQLIQNILNLQRARPSVATPHEPIPHDELVGRLGDLQIKSIPAFGEGDIPVIIVQATPDALSTRLRQEKPDRSISRLDSDVIELVGMLFEYMLNDEALPDSAKALLSYLHTPYLKLALIDREFFEQPQHPARILLNHMVEAGEKWLDANAQSRNVVLQQMRSVVQRILDDFKEDTTIFSELALEFSGFLRQHERRVKMAEERARQAAKGEDKLREIRQRVYKLLDERIVGMRIPSPIYTLLYEAWTAYLCFSLLRFGDNSLQWLEGLRVVDDILWFIKPKLEWDDKRRTQEMKTVLFPALQTGFDVVGYNSQEGERLLKSLNLCQRLATDSLVDPALREAMESESDEPPASVQELRNKYRKPEIPIADAELVDELNRLDFGTWFIFTGQGGMQHLKLAWYNANTMHFMFVNKMGQQVAVKRADELAADIKAGKVHIVETDSNKPFFEKALERILAQFG
jgi:hypothetical protein